VIAPNPVEARRPAKAREGGFSMIEVVVAMMILTIGVLGLAGTTAYIVRQITLGDLMTERSAAFQTIIDRLQSLPYDQVTSGNTTVGVFAISWTSTNDGPQNKIVRMITVGPGLGGALVPTNDPQAVDTFTFRVLRR
jgi:prepilin-type N-terminal cleavage/methylation domain-containing protein